MFPARRTRTLERISRRKKKVFAPTRRTAMRWKNLAVSLAVALRFGNIVLYWTQLPEA
jgi:hypothetical protein